MITIKIENNGEKKVKILEKNRKFFLFEITKMIKMRENKLMNRIDKILKPKTLSSQSPVQIIRAGKGNF